MCVDLATAMTSQKGSYEAKSVTFAHEYTYTHNIINMQSITQFSQSATLRVNANKASLNKSSKKVSVQVRAAVSMPSMDSQDEGDDVVQTLCRKMAEKLVPTPHHHNGER